LNYGVAISSSAAPADLADQAIKLQHVRHFSWAPRGEEHTSLCVEVAIDSRAEPAAAFAHLRQEQDC